jgi:hypothetical protein
MEHGTAPLLEVEHEHGSIWAMGYRVARTPAIGRQQEKEIDERR